MAARVSGITYFFSIAADTKAKAVSAFSNILAEVRSLGEGIVIVDQSPEKSAPDAMRNTNLQIAHQLRDVKDRESIERTMIMDEIQQEYLGILHIGEAAIFMTEIEKACIVQVPNFKTVAKFCESLPDGQIMKLMEVFHQNLL